MFDAFSSATSELSRNQPSAVAGLGGPLAIGMLREPPDLGFA